jgi:UDPglucose--hexose-1-phosphate uridylyltransferase
VSEFRQDPTTGEWVIVAPERGQRPGAVPKFPARSEGPRREADCPFCPGNEALTPPEILRVPAGGGWRVRVVPNKFAAVVPQSSLQARQGDGLLVSRNGWGFHEVIVETPDHWRQMAQMDPQEVAEVLRVYRHRYNALRTEPRVKMVFIFKNQGERAGTSLSHPHSQLVATSLVPPFIQRRVEVARNYQHDTGNCLYCALRAVEAAAKERLVFESPHHMVLQAFAPRAPFETWLLPVRHYAAFGDIEEAEIDDLAQILRDTLKAIGTQLGDPDFNYLVHSGPMAQDQSSYYHWYLQIIPRIATAAGLELGTGLSVTTALPEETARLLREGWPPAASATEWGAR